MNQLDTPQLAAGSFIYDFAEITRYYIRTRYPVDNPFILNKEQVGKAIEVAEEVLSFVKMKIADKD